MTIAWLLPDGVVELLPEQAEQLENLRRDCLNLYQTWGYRQVFPPLIEYLDSLLIGSGEDLALQTLKITDQLTGRLMGVRADITPQIARIDAHRLKSINIINRFCYVGSVLHAKPESLMAPRNFIQAGVEIYGHSGIESDREGIEMMLNTFQLLDPQMPLLVNIGHVGIFNILFDSIMGSLNEPCSVLMRKKLLDTIKRKNTSELNQLAEQLKLSISSRRQLLAWASIQGGLSIFPEIKALSQEVKYQSLVSELEQMLFSLQEAYPAVDWFLDLAELHSYEYHTGIVYSAYPNNLHREAALGGRYDDLGQAFGCARPATGFSVDLLALVDLQSSLGVRKGIKEIIWAPYNSGQDISEREKLRKAIDELRYQKKRVVQAFSESDNGREFKQHMVCVKGEWVVRPSAINNVSEKNYG